LREKVVAKCVQFGAGNIGRGFLAQLCTQSGYEIVFVDVVDEVVEMLDEKGQYTLKLIGERDEDLTIRPVRAVSGRDVEAVAKEITDAEIISTAVGNAALPAVAKTISAGLERRWQEGNDNPINIIICENLHDAPKLLHGWLQDALSEKVKPLLKERVGLVMTVIARMVPVVTEEMKHEDPLIVFAEPYPLLPVDGEGFVGDPPKIRHMIPCSNFSAFVDRKLYVHNGLHAMASYWGYLEGLEYTWQAVESSGIRERLERAGAEISAALQAEHGFDPVHLAEHVNDLLRRFANRRLGDTIARVGKDPIRKLGYDDRLVGGARLILKHGGDISLHVDAIRDAFRFIPPGDPSAEKLQKMLKEHGVEYVLQNICGLPPDHPISKMILET
jgi:mannitol-1-phosphate 5-dehydrogenase